MTVIINKVEDLEAFIGGLAKGKTIEAGIEALPLYYDVIFEDEEIVQQARSHEKAVECAHNWWAEKCEDDGIANGETMEDVAEIVTYRFGDNDKEVVKREDITLSYEGYHGDYAEHNLNYFGGLL